MDKYGLVGILGRAFRERKLATEEGHWKVTGALFHGYFHLRELRSTHRVDSSHADFGLVRDLNTETINRENTSLKPYSPWKTQALEIPPDQISHLQIHLAHTNGFDLRVGLLALIRKFGGHTIRWDCQMLDITQHLQRDTFWIDCPYAQLRELLQGPFGSPEDLQVEILRIHDAVHQEDMSKRGLNTSESQKPWKAKDPAEERGVDSLLSALHASDRRSMSKQVAQIPPAMKDKVLRLPYEISLCTWGVQRQNYKKYMGSGIIRNKAQDKDAPLVQFSTFFIRDSNLLRAANSPSGFASKTALDENQFAEFVCSIDVLHRRFTIERAVLDAAGTVDRNIPAVAVSEQLCAPVWEPSGFAIFAQSSLLPVESIQEIKLSKVFDWNTYALMCLALIRRGQLQDVFKDSFGDSAVLQQELKASGLTYDDMEQKSLVEIFLRTGMGRLVQNVLELWQKRTSVFLNCVEAAVVLQESQDYVHGELHRAMEITCKVQVVSRKKLADPDRQAGQLPSSKSVEEWAYLIQELAPDQLHYGFQLGQEGTHEHVRATAVLRAASRALHNLQRERGWSCLALADSSGNTVEQLQMQRSKTDACFVDALSQTTSTSVRMVTTNLLLVRAQVDESMGKQLPGEESYGMFCTAPGTFNSLIGTLLEWLVRAVIANPETQPLESQNLRLMCYFKEILGRERAFLLSSRGSSDQGKVAERQAALMAGARKLIIRLSEGDLGGLLKQLDEAHVIFMEDQHDLLAWFDVMSSCIDVCQAMVEELLGDNRSPEDESLSLHQFVKRSAGPDFAIIQISL